MDSHRLAEITAKLTEKLFPDGYDALVRELVEAVRSELRPKLPRLVYTNKGSRVLQCYCGKLYDEDAVDADAYFICECGKLGQRMDEAELTPLAADAVAGGVE